MINLKMTDLLANLNQSNVALAITRVSTSGEDWGDPPTTQKVDLSPPPIVTLLFCPKNVNFLIFMQSSILCSNWPLTSQPHLENLITGAIKCTSPSLESLESRRRLRCLCALHKIIPNELPAYLCSDRNNSQLSVTKTKRKLRIINQKSH